MGDVNLEILRKNPMLSQLDAAMLLSESTDTKSEQFTQALTRIKLAIHAKDLPSFQMADLEMECGNIDKAKKFKAIKHLNFIDRFVDERQLMVRQFDFSKWMLEADRSVVETNTEGVKLMDSDNIERVDMISTNLEIAKYNAAKARNEAELAKFNADIAQANAAESKSKEEEAKANALEAKAREEEARAKAEEAKAIAASKPIEKRMDNGLVRFVGELATKLSYLPFDRNSVGKLKRDKVSELSEKTIRKYLKLADKEIYRSEK